MSSYGDDTDGFDPYFGLDFTWMDSPLSEWFQTSIIDEIDEAIAADAATPIGLKLPVVDDAATSYM